MDPKHWITALLTLFHCLLNGTWSLTSHILPDLTEVQVGEALTLEWFSSNAASPLHDFVFNYWLAVTIGCRTVASRVSMGNLRCASRPKYTLPRLSYGNIKNTVKPLSNEIESQWESKRVVSSWECTVSKWTKSSLRHINQSETLPANSLARYPLSTQSLSTLKDSCSHLARA